MVKSTELMCGNIVIVLSKMIPMLVAESVRTITSNSTLTVENFGGGRKRE